jgi:hypothetical protein
MIARSLVEDFDSRSIRQQALRQRYIDSNIVAIGKPQSIQRFAQIESLLSAGGDVPGTVKEVRKVAEGKYMAMKLISLKRCGHRPDARASLASIGDRNQLQLRQISCGDFSSKEE